MKRLLFTFAMISSASWGCTILSFPTFVEFKSADVVFVGKVRNVITMPIARGEKRRKIYTFTTSDEKIAKGEQSDTIKVYGSLDMGGCEDTYDFVLGHEYIVFGYLHPASSWLHKNDAQGDLPKPNDKIISGISLATLDTSDPHSDKVLDEVDKILKDQLLDAVDRLLGPGHDGNFEVEDPKGVLKK